MPGQQRKRRTNLTEEKVREIRKLIADGAPVGAIALKYGVSRDAIQAIKAGRTFKGVGLIEDSGSENLPPTDAMNDHPDPATLSGVSSHPCLPGLSHHLVWSEYAKEMTCKHCSMTATELRQSV